MYPRHENVGQDCILTNTVPTPHFVSACLTSVSHSRDGLKSIPGFMPHLSHLSQSVNM